MPIITVASTKGGVGKSTVAINLITELSKSNKVILLDGDPQQSAAKWHSIRAMQINSGVKLATIEVEPVQGEPLASMATTKSSAGYLVLIDSAGVDHNSTRTALVKSDYVLIVSTTDPIDLWEVETVLKLVKELELKQQRAITTVLVFNKVATQYNIKDVLNATEFLRANNIKPTHILKAVIKNRRAYKFAVGEGKGIAEYTPADNVARAEFAAMATELLTIVNPD